ncbi:Mix17 protein [Pichia kluyveri]|uniref:Mix17 protein n=1 Tax=Pichia kluyveri TaxID=36015 RepID=A0AAV5R9D0_PICKL|nr:Mix17 protein [Pichia kluyveri]
MPRNSSRRPAPASNAGSKRSVFGGNTQSRSASTMAAPAASYRGPATTSAAPAPVGAPAAVAPQQPGLFAQMATTAAGVAVGSAVGHTLGAGLTSIFSGSSSDAPAQQQQVPIQQSQGLANENNNACAADARNFTRCLEDSNGNYQACDFYLQQLKACQAAASQY